MGKMAETEKTTQVFDSKSNDLSIIWKNIRQGNQTALAALFELSSDRLYRYGMKFINNRELVEDSIQELFIRLCQNPNKLPDVYNPIFYLFKSLRNILIDAIREKDKLTLLSLEELPFNVNILWNHEPGDDVNETIQKQFDIAISLLSERQKEAIYLRFEVGVSYDEIAQLLGINYQSARNLIHRSVNKIRSQMRLKSFLFLFLS